MQQALAVNEQTVQWHVARRRKTLEKLNEGWQQDLAQAYEKLKARVRAYVQHPFHVGKNIFKLIRASLAMHGGVINEHTPLLHHCLNLAQAQWIGHMPAHACQHHFEG